MTFCTVWNPVLVRSSTKRDLCSRVISQEAVVQKKTPHLVRTSTPSTCTRKYKCTALRSKLYLLKWMGSTYLYHFLLLVLVFLRTRTCLKTNWSKLKKVALSRVESKFACECFYHTKSQKLLNSKSTKYLYLFDHHFNSDMTTREVM